MSLRIIFLKAVITNGSFNIFCAQAIFYAENTILHIVDILLDANMWQSFKGPYCRLIKMKIQAMRRAEPVYL